MELDASMGTAVSGAIHLPFGDHVLAWAPQAGQPVLVDSADWLLWGFCDGELTVDTLADDLAASLDMRPDMARARALEAKRNLEAGGLLAGNPGPQARLDFFPRPPNN